MSIGLYDEDFMTYTPICFNLDLMKLSAFYKTKKEVVVLAPQLEPERYSKFYFRKDYNDGYFDRQIFMPNVDYGGHAFSGEKYVTLPEPIQLIKPDKHLYDKLIYKYQDTKTLNLIFNTMVNAEHVRLSLNGKDVWKDFEKTINITNKTRCLIFHDYDLGKIKDSNLIVKELIKQMPPYYQKRGQLIGMKFPVQLNNEKDFEQWISFNPMNRMFGLQYNGLMNNEFFQDFLLRSNSSTLSRNLYYNVTHGCSSENDFIENRLPKIFRQILLSRSLFVKISLKYDDNFFVDKRWERILFLFSLYSDNQEKKYKKNLLPNRRNYNNTFTLYRYITTTKFFTNLLKNRKDWFTKEEMRDLFQMVREKSYETFKMFYESCKVELKGGEIVDV